MQLQGHELHSSARCISHPGRLPLTMITKTRTKCRSQGRQEGVETLNLVTAVCLHNESDHKQGTRLMKTNSQAREKEDGLQDKEASK